MLVARNLETATAQPESGDAEERLRRGSKKEL